MIENSLVTLNTGTFCYLKQLGSKYD